MAKSILIFKSSPRAKSNSSLLAERAAQGAVAAGATVELFNLPDMHIQPCDACDVCQETGVCVLKDDMQELYPKLRAADGVLLSSPVYWFSLSAQVKLFIDRWYGLEGPQGSALKGKQLGLILTYGDDDPYSSGAINAIRTFQDMARYLGAGIAGMVYGTANKEGEIQDQPELLEQAYRLGSAIGKEPENG